MLGGLARRLGAWLSGEDQRPPRHLGIGARLHLIEERLRIMEHFNQGGRATYVGGGLVLVKCVVRGTQIVFYVHGDDRLLSPWFITSGGYETELTDFFVRTLRPDDRCIDVGANFGWFTCLFARFAPRGRVIGIEPDPTTFELLRDNIHANGLPAIAKAMQAAVADQAGPVTLHRRLRRAGNTSITRASDAFVAKLGEPPAERFEVAGTTLDALAATLDGRVDVVKVDVEGAEPLVFRGATEMIARNPQIQIVMEWSPVQIRGAGFDVAEFLDSLQAMQLRFFDIDSGTPRPLSKDEVLGLDYRGGILLAREPR